MDTYIANSVTGSNERDGILLTVRLVLHEESGELRMAEQVWDHEAGAGRLAIWGDSVRHYRRIPRERR